MAKDNSKFVKGIEIKESDVLLNKSLEITVDSGATSDTKTTLKAAQSSNVTVTLPNATDTLVGRATTDTLTNKSIDDDNNAITNLALTGIKTVLGQANNFLSRDVTGAVIDTKAVPTGAVVGTSDTQTLTNKTIDGSSSGTNTIQNTAFDVEYDNSGSTLTATHVNDAVDQLDLKAEAATAGPASSTDNALVRFDGTTGKLVQNSGTTLDDSGNMIVQNDLTVLGNLQVDGTTTTVNTATLDVEDANITINKNGNQATADDVAGLTVEMTDATDVAIVYDKDVASRWKVGDVGSEAQIATVSHTQTLTNKTIAAGSNTITGLLHGTQVDNPSSGVHGVTGSVVGTSDAQDLSNKTFTNPVILEEQASSPSTPSSGDRKLYSKTDGKLYHKGSDGVERKVGSGSGASVNYHEDYDCDDISKVSVYDDGGAVPTDGAGGTTSVTATLETSAPLAGTGSYKLSKGASNLQGEGWAVNSSALDDLEAGGPNAIWINFSYKTSANYASGDVTVYAYRVGSSTLEAVNTFQGSSFTNSLPAAPNGSTYAGWITASSSDTSIRLILHVASTNATAYDIHVDRLSIGPQSVVQSGIMSDWQSYTPTYGGVGTVSSAYALWRRVGDSIEVTGRFTTGTTTSSAVSISLPNSYTIDATKITASNLAGLADANISSATLMGFCTLAVPGASSIALGERTSAQSLIATSIIGTAIGDAVVTTYSFRAPITGWTSGNTMSTAELAVRNARARYSTNAGQSISTATTTIVNFEDKSYDTHNAVTTGGSWKFTAPATGYYKVTSRLLFTNTSNWNAGEFAQFSLYKNGSVYSQLDYVDNYFTGTAMFGSVRGSDTVYLVAGDYIDIRIYQNTGSALTIDSAATFTYVSIEQLPDLTVLGVNGSPVEITNNSSSTKTPSASAHFHSHTNNSLTLTAGTWELLPSRLTFSSSGGSAAYISLQGGWSGANGGDNGTFPTALKDTAGITVLTTPSATTDFGGRSVFLPTSGVSDWVTSTGSVIIRVSQTVTVYLNTYAEMTTPANARINVYPNAKRLQ